MNAKLLIALLLLSLPRPAAAADRQWVLEQSTLTYHVSHRLPKAKASAMRREARAFVTKDNAIS